MTTQTTMAKEEFAEAVKGKVMEMLGPDVEITISEMRKNNQVSYPCMTIRHPERRLAPNVKINDMYALYNNGHMDIEEIAEKIVAAYEGTECDTSDLEYLQTDPKKLYDKIIFRLVNYDRNKEMLNRCPHIRILDLAVIFCLTISLPNNESGDVKIDDRIASMLELNAKELMSYALQNTPKLCEAECRGINSVISEILAKNAIPASIFPTFSEEMCERIPLKVLTNTFARNGAATILYPGVLERIREQLGQDFYILPSSVHEVLITPCEDIGAEFFIDMVKEVNQTTVPPEEILSDNVYCYPRDFKELESLLA